MIKVVIDASVAISWLTAKNEREFEAARKVYELIIRQQVEAWAPTFLLVEVLNILVMKKKIEVKEAKKFIRRLAKSGIRFMSLAADDAENLASLMSKYQVTAYDAEYLWLVKKKECRLLTCDGDLLKINRLTVSLADFMENVEGGRWVEGGGR